MNKYQEIYKIELAFINKLKNEPKTFTKDELSDDIKYFQSKINEFNNSNKANTNNNLSNKKNEEIKIVKGYIANLEKFCVYIQTKLITLKF